MLSISRTVKLGLLALGILRDPNPGPTLGANSGLTLGVASATSIWKSLRGVQGRRRSTAPLLLHPFIRLVDGESAT